ncbi:MAG: bifunctional sugar-1-phosphate nucleotidylyltransferase/acetyltransferase [Candidatus Aenigmatarchaeota archaeon]
MKAVILAAGKGTRAFPLTENKPKCMLNVLNRPLLYYIVEKLKNLGIEEMGIVVGYKDKKIKEYFGKNFKYFKQKKLLGTANALYQARNFVDGKFLVLNGDVYFEDSLKEFLKMENTICVSFVEDTSSYGRVLTKGNNLLKIEEKSKGGKGLINSGVYIFDEKIFDAIEKTKENDSRKEYEITDSINLISRKVKIYKLKGYWHDVTFPWDLLKINLHALNKLDDIVIGKNTEVWSSAIIRKPTVIGENCTIKNCVIESSVIGNDCTVGEFSIVKRSIVGNSSNVPHLNYVGDSVIGENCNLGAGTKIANLRFDEKEIFAIVKNQKVCTGLKKFGAVIGDGTKTGINVSIYPGRIIGCNKLVKPHSEVIENII